MEPGLPEKIVAVHERLQLVKISHAFGGALALAYYAEPRATIDIDLNVFVSATHYGGVAAALSAVGVSAPSEAPRLAQRDGQCRLWWGHTPLDVYFAYHDLHEAMRTALRRVPFANTSIPVLAPEHLLVCKALFDRPKDWLDIEQMIVGVDELDCSQIVQWLDAIVGSQDRRRTRVAQLLGEFS